MTLEKMEVKGKAITSTISVSEDLLADAESRFMEALRDELAQVIVRDTIYYTLHYRGERHWECLWCGAWYMRNHRPAACQKCGATIFAGTEPDARPWRRRR